jgi:hypothetical protein
MGLRVFLNDREDFAFVERSGKTLEFNVVEIDPPNLNCFNGGVTSSFLSFFVWRGVHEGA